MCNLVCIITAVVMILLDKYGKERAMLCPGFTASEQAQKTSYLSMLKMDIRQLVSTQLYGSFLKLQVATRWQEIETELQTREQRQVSVQSQPAPKRFKVIDTRFVIQRGHTCGKCGKVHEGACRSTGVCHKYGKEGHYERDCRQLNPVLSTKI